MASHKGNCFLTTVVNDHPSLPIHALSDVSQGSVVTFPIPCLHLYVSLPRTMLLTGIILLQLAKPRFSATLNLSVHDELVECYQMFGYFFHMPYTSLSSLLHFR